jgi:hypothetical protein
MEKASDLDGVGEARMESAAANTSVGVGGGEKGRPGEEAVWTGLGEPRRPGEVVGLAVGEEK